MKSSKTSASAARRRRPEPLGATPSEADAPLAPAPDAPRYETFTIRLLLDAEGACRRTEVTHVQHGLGDAWPGYERERLADWIADRLGPAAAPVGLPPAETMSEAATAPEVPPAAPPRPRPAVASLRDVALAEGGALRAAGEALVVRFALDLAGGVAGEPVAYRASVLARELGGGAIELGVADGLAAPGEPMFVEVAGVTPPPGSYRLGASVALGESAAGALVAGPIVQVYEP